MQKLITLLLLLAIGSPVIAAEAQPDPDATWSRWGKSQIRWMVTGSTDGADDRFGVHPDPNWQSAPGDRRRVALVHGFNSGPSSLQPLAAALRRRGHPCAMVCYPNDQSIDRTAKRVARELRPLLGKLQGAPVALLTHSMGGLVARRIVEDKRLDLGNVDRLMMIAPPNHGSSLARIAAGTDLYEHLLLAEAPARKTGFYHSFDDGVGEAVHDMKPGSRFLTRLNTRQRNPRVAYTIILGNRGRFTDLQLEAARRTVAAASNHRWTRQISPHLNGLLDECDELLAGRGDGAVSVARGKLAGVDDVHILPGTHDMIYLRGNVGERLETLVAERLN